MPQLNLTEYSKSDICYKIDRFPDGQINFQFIGLKPESRLSSMRKVYITSRMSWNDVQVIMAAVPALRKSGAEWISLYVPYFLGARSDRQFAEGATNYVKEVIAPMINSLKLDRVAVLDPHSDVVEACLNNFEKINNDVLVGKALKDAGLDGQSWLWIVPDAGASKKAYDNLHAQVARDLVICGKHRDVLTGKILSTYVPEGKVHDQTCVIVDDICDGGRTFIELAKELKNNGAGDLYLIVSHGIFSAGFSELQKYFKRIYCTDSYQTMITDLVKQPVKFF